MSGSSTPSSRGSPPPSPPAHTTKRIGIIGAGFSGIGALLGLLDLPEHAREGWEINLLERRKDVAGLWLADGAAVAPPGLPETPLYPLLRTNTPSPTISFPNLPFPPHSSLFPPHAHVQAYVRAVVQSKDLERYIQLNSNVTATAWNDSAQAWDVDFTHDGKPTSTTFDHLIIANGHYAYPKIPTWLGSEEWLKGGDREIVHSLWYRGAETLADRTVLVVGFGSSGWDIVKGSVPYAKEVHHSYSDPPEGVPVKLPPVPGSVRRQRISHFTSTSIVFTDGTTLDSDKVTVFLATGYKYLIPFLKNLSVAPLNPKFPTRTLTTNGKYITPLHLDLFAADASIPPNRLAFVGLPWYTAAGATGYSQGLTIGHALAVDEFLPTHEEIWAGLEEKERSVRERGEEPTLIGHKFIDKGDAEAYQNGLINLIRARSPYSLPSYLSDPSTPYVEDWRWQWRALNGLKLNGIYAQAIVKGVEKDPRFTSETGTQEDWVRAMEELNKWGDEQEEEAGKVPVNVV